MKKLEDALAVWPHISPTTPQSRPAYDYWAALCCLRVCSPLQLNPLQLPVALCISTVPARTHPFGSGP
jgi:hypothetical protein